MALKRCSRKFSAPVRKTLHKSSLPVRQPSHSESQERRWSFRSPVRASSPWTQNSLLESSALNGCWRTIWCERRDPMSSAIGRSSRFWLPWSHSMSDSWLCEQTPAWLVHFSGVMAHQISLSRILLLHAGIHHAEKLQSMCRRGQEWCLLVADRGWHGQECVVQPQLSRDKEVRGCCDLWPIWTWCPVDATSIFSILDDRTGWGCRWYERSRCLKRLVLFRWRRLWSWRPTLKRYVQQFIKSVRSDHAWCDCQKVLSTAWCSENGSLTSLML